MSDFKIYGDNPEHIHSFKNISTDHGYFRNQWCIITDPAALESMKQLRIYTYGGLWIWPGWDYEGHKEGSNMVWYPLRSHLDGQTAALYTFPKQKHMDRNEYHIVLWLTNHPDPTSDGAIYHNVL